MSRIHLGAPVDVKVQALNETSRARSRASPTSSNLDTRTMDTEVDVPNPNLELVPGMYAQRVDHARRERRTCCVVPVQAIDRKDDQTTVMVVGADGRLELRDRDDRSRVAGSRRGASAACARAIWSVVGNRGAAEAGQRR